MDRLNWRLQQAARALASFKQLAYIESPSMIERDAAIQRFEYTTEVLLESGAGCVAGTLRCRGGEPKSSYSRSRTKRTFKRARCAFGDGFNQRLALQDLQIARRSAFTLIATSPTSTPASRKTHDEPHN